MCGCNKLFTCMRSITHCVIGVILLALIIICSHPMPVIWSVGSQLKYALLCDFLVTRPVVFIIEDAIEERQKWFSEKHAIASYTNTK